MPRLAIKPNAAGVSVLPARNAGSPCCKSSPALRRLSPAWRMPAGTSMTVSSPELCTVASSWAITVSRPAGITAPVMILTHSPNFTLPCQALPARAVPTTRNCKGAAPSCLPSNAKPSMAELSCAGTLMGEMVSSATMRPRACMSGRSSLVIGDWALTR